jgi:sigma-54 dependent transcriptional regulator, flagellar regulatory protein
MVNDIPAPLQALPSAGARADEAMASNSPTPEPNDLVRRLLIGDSAVMRELRSLIRRVANTDAAVVITGPSGAGKEVVARALHAASKCAGPLVSVNCGAIPAELIESELFGHEKGSFTGAIAQRRGRFEQADGGVLFLDEIGDMPLAMQVKLLRVLEERRIERVGGTGSIAVRCRIICATHRDLPTEIAAGRFREDLWYRLAVVPLHVPALAERVTDLPALVAHLQAGAIAPPRFTDAALALLMTHQWPGNVRELRNVVARAAILHGDTIIDAPAINALIAATPALPQSPEMGLSASQITGMVAQTLDLKSMLTELERRHIIAALGAAHGVVADAARLVGLGRTTFLEKMKRHDVTRAVI